MSHLSNDFVAYAAAIILYHMTNSSDVVGHFLRYLRQIRTCSISRASAVLDLKLLALRELRKILRKHYFPCVAYVPCVRLETGP